MTAGECERPGVIPAFFLSAGEPLFSAVIVRLVRNGADDPVRRGFSALSLPLAFTGCPAFAGHDDAL
jgi:hypothetical protein